jgi:two-component system cell cycle response regulator DivK
MSRILLVEDNAMNRDMLMRRLARKGYEVLVAEDGAQAIETAREEQPDLILMDMSLPEIDGWEATRRLKADPATQPIPIIALTAHAMVSDKEKAMRAGCDDYDSKPVDLKRLLTKIAGQLGVASAPGHDRQPPRFCRPARPRPARAYVVPTRTEGGAQCGPYATSRSGANSRGSRCPSA